MKVGSILKEKAADRLIRCFFLFPAAASADIVMTFRQLSDKPHNSEILTNIITLKTFFISIHNINGVTDIWTETAVILTWVIAAVTVLTVTGHRIPAAETPETAAEVTADITVSSTRFSGIR